MMLQTKRLQIVPLAEKYANKLLELWQDEEVIRYTNVKKLKNVDAVRDKIELWLANEEKSEYVSHFVILKDEEVVGVIGIPTIKDEEEKRGFYYQIIRRFWNKGYGKEAAKAVFEYALKEVKVKALFADSVMLNEGSIKILKDLGFEELGMTRNGFAAGGKLYHVVHFKYENKHINEENCINKKIPM